MTRITYQKINNKLHTPHFLSGNNFYKAVIDLDTMTGRIYDYFEVNKLVVKGDTLNSIKKSLKQGLINLGVNFQPEVRPGRTLKRRGK